MEVILLSKFNKLGDSGTVVHVKPGYARNFLIPHGKAILANKKNIESFEAQKMFLEKESNKKFIIAKLRADKIREIKQITVFSKVGKEGKIFGSVGIKYIIKALADLGIKVNRKEFKLPNGVLRKIGEHEVIFKPHHKINEILTINIAEKK